MKGLRLKGQNFWKVGSVGGNFLGRNEHGVLGCSSLAYIIFYWIPQRRRGQGIFPMLNITNVLESIFYESS